MRGQLSIFDFIKIDSMFDGYEVVKTKTIETNGSRIKLNAGDICYLVSKNCTITTIEFPNNFGGSFGITITANQFNNLFRSLGRKVYPKRKEIWNGKIWIDNPELCSSLN